MATDDTRRREELFVVRIWTEPSQYAATWRASVTHVATRECRYLLGYAELLEFLDRWRDAASGPGDAAAAQARARITLGDAR